MDISTAWPKSHIHTWIYPWISISTASLVAHHCHPRTNSRQRLWNCISGSQLLRSVTCHNNGIRHCYLPPCSA